MPKSESILILFDGDHLAYSPTVIQLCHELDKYYEVIIFTKRPKGITEKILERRGLVFFEYDFSFRRFFYRLLFELKLLFNDREARHFKNKSYGYYFDYFFRYLKIKKIIKKNTFVRIVSVDIKNLFFCSLMNVKSDFLSLELPADKYYLRFINKKLINCVITQTKERYSYLFGEESHKTFFIQNAPIYKEVNKRQIKKGLIYAGTAIEAFGLYFCLDYLRNFSGETLFIQGAIPKIEREKILSNYGDLINSKRLVLADSYLENDQVVEYISRFEIGFCFYNFEIQWINTINYQTAPSGKLFKYLAAGIPVICSDILGFKFVDEFRCGILLDEVNSLTIHNAIVKIRENYIFYSDNCLIAAKYYSFDKAVAKYIEFIKGGINIENE